MSKRIDALFGKPVVVQAKQLNDSFWDDEEELLLEVLLPLILDAGLAGARTAYTNMILAGITVDWSLINKAAVKWAREYSGSLVKGITGTSKVFVREKLADWIESGEPLDKLIDNLTPMFGRVRAELIGVTENTAAFANGNLITWREAGVKKHQWMTANDELVCEWCGPLDGMIAEDGGNGFTTETGDDALGPQAPPLHPRCRCWLQPVIDLPGAE